MERAIMRDMGEDCYKSSRITMILNRLGQGNINEGVMILSYAGIPIYLVSEYDLDQIYQTIIDCKRRGGESREDIVIWLNGQPIESGLREELVSTLKSA